MRLYRLAISGFRRIKHEEYIFGDATFLVGANNVGKSSVLRAIGMLLAPSDSKLPAEEFFSCIDGETCQQCSVDEVVIEGEFRNVPREARQWKGFKRRLLKYEIEENSDESGLSIVYRKTYNCGESPLVQMLVNKRQMRKEFAAASTIEELVGSVIDESTANVIFGKSSGKMNVKDKARLDEYEDAWDIDSTEQVWDDNPGGWKTIIASKLPTFISIPLDDGSGEINSKTGALNTIMVELFSQVRDESSNYTEAQKYLDLLAQELDPSKDETPFGTMMNELNNVLAEVFDNARFHARADLSKPDDAIKPTFEYQMSSNIKTPVYLQGTGMIRSAVFALLRFRQNWLAKRKATTRGLIIGFEEPEIYLHPNAVNQMRDTIYELSAKDSQIVCTTHSPFMIDLSRKQRQVLNRIRPTDKSIENVVFSLSQRFKELQDEDKLYVKMLLKVDDYSARVFFADHVLVVEGDTEEIVLRETIGRMPEGVKVAVLCGTQVVRARGKASIIPFVRYLRAFGIAPFVIHDSDLGVKGAEKFNEPIVRAAGGDQYVIRLDNCIEDVLGYAVPSSEKPYNAYMVCSAWGDKWEDVPDVWRGIVASVFSKYFSR